MNLIKRNSIILLLALVVAFALFSLLKYPGLFEASVLDAQSRQLMIQEHWDIAYLVTGNQMDIFLNPEITAPHKLNLTIGYDPTLQLSGLYETQCSGSLTLQEESSHLFWEGCPDLNLTTSITSLLFTGRIPHLLIEEALAFSGDIPHSLSIGNLGLSGAQIH